MDEYRNRFGIRDSVVLSVCSGLVLAFAFPRFELPGVVWIALVPLLFVLDRNPMPKVFAYSWLQGFVFFVGVLYWIPVGLISYAHASLAGGLAKLLLLAAVEAFSVAAALTLGELISRRLGLPRTITLPTTWVAFELMRTYLPVGFPWALLGYAAYRDVTLIQFAEFTGIYGVSALIVLVNVAAFEMLTRSQPLKAKLAVTAPAFGVLVIALLFGTARISQLRATPAAGSLRVAMVQANIPQSLKWKQSNVEPTFQIYAQEMLSASRQHPDLVIWPETAAPFYFIAQADYADGPLRFHQSYHDRLLKLVRDTRQPLLFGAPALDFGDRISTRNRVYLISGDGNVVDYYDKMMLVPFYEYLPMASFLGRLFDKAAETTGLVTAGTLQRILPVKDAKIGVLICYESMFPAIARRSVQAGANVLVNLSNDAGFGTTSAPYQLLAMAAMRAVENHTPMVRVANTGISAVITPTGEIVAATRLATRVTETETVSWTGTRTFYTEHGDLFAGFCAAATTVGALVAFVFRSARMKPSIEG